MSSKYYAMMSGEYGPEFVMLGEYETDDKANDASERICDEQGFFSVIWVYVENEFLRFLQGIATNRGDKVLIEVLGGVAYTVKAPEYIDVEIIDYDNDYGDEEEG